MCNFCDKLRSVVRDDLKRSLKSQSAQLSAVEFSSLVRFRLDSIAISLVRASAFSGSYEGEQND